MSMMIAIARDRCRSDGFPKAGRIMVAEERFAARPILSVYKQTGQTARYFAAVYASVRQAHEQSGCAVTPVTYRPKARGRPSPTGSFEGDAGEPQKACAVYGAKRSCPEPGRTLLAQPLTSPYHILTQRANALTWSLRATSRRRYLRRRAIAPTLTGDEHRVDAAGVYPHRAIAATTSRPSRRARSQSRRNFSASSK